MGADTTVVLADDEPDLVGLFEAFLADGFDVRTTTEGQEVLELVDDSVDVVLLDRRMPDMHGDEVLAAIREQGYEMPVGMVTAVDPDVDIVDMPFDAYLTKPITRDDLRETVELLTIRSDFDEKRREFFRLAAKKAALESREGSLEDSEEYRELVERMEQLQEQLDETLETVLEKHPTDAFHSLLN